MILLITISSCCDSFWSSCSDLHSPGTTSASLGLDLVVDFMLVGGTTGGGFETLGGDKTHCFITKNK